MDQGGSGGHRATVPFKRFAGRVLLACSWYGDNLRQRGIVRGGIVERNNLREYPSMVTFACGVRLGQSAGYREVKSRWIGLPALKADRLVELLRCEVVAVCSNSKIVTVEIA